MKYQISYKAQFESALYALLDFIQSRDGIERADKFANELLDKIEQIPYTMPYGRSKNRTLNDDNVRDLIFKGYTVPYRINDDTIEILTIYKWNLPSF